MAKKAEHDLLNWTSFPSSIKLFNDEAKQTWIVYYPTEPRILPVAQGRPIKVDIKARLKNINFPRTPSHIQIHAITEEGGQLIKRVLLPMGTHDWETYTLEAMIPPNINRVRLSFAGGAGTSDKPGLSWFDDLKVYQDGKLIYDNDFTAPILPLVAGLTPVLTVGAVVGTQEFKRIAQGIP